jgi:hypothetical protein
MSEVEDNAYTGHAQTSHTAASSYFHLSAIWAGNVVASLKTKGSISPEALEAIAADARERFEEEDAEYGEGETVRV